MSPLTESKLNFANYLHYFTHRSVDATRITIMNLAHVAAGVKRFLTEGSLVTPERKFYNVATTGERIFSDLTSYVWFIQQHGVITQLESQGCDAEKIKHVLQTCTDPNAAVWILSLSEYVTQTQRINREYRKSLEVQEGMEAVQDEHSVRLLNDQEVFEQLIANRQPDFTIRDWTLGNVKIQETADEEIINDFLLEAVQGVVKHRTHAYLAGNQTHNAHLYLERLARDFIQKFDFTSTGQEKPGMSAHLERLLIEALSDLTDRFDDLCEFNQRNHIYIPQIVAGYNCVLHYYDTDYRIICYEHYFNPTDRDTTFDD